MVIYARKDTEKLCPFTEFVIDRFLFVLIRASSSGGYRRGATPVPIPNTEVKPSTGDGTDGAVHWESSKLPVLIMPRIEFKLDAGFFIVRPAGNESDDHESS